MLSTCDDTSTLDTLDRLGELDTSQDRVRTVWSCQRRENLLHRNYRQRYLKPSQFLPPSGERPSGPATGPSCTSVPFIWCSEPMACPRAYARPRSNVAATLTPAGKTELKSAVERLAYTKRLYRIVIRTVSDTNGGILHAHASESQSRYGTILTNAAFTLPSACSLESVDLIQKGADRWTYPTPVVRLTFSVNVSWLTNACAFA